MGILDLLFQRMSLLLVFFLCVCGVRRGVWMSFFSGSINANRLFIIIYKIEFMQVVVAPMARGTTFRVLLNHSHTHTLGVM